MKHYEACKHCSDKHTSACYTCTSSKRDRIMNPRDGDSDFLTSAVVGAVTGSTLAGWAVGGDLTGAFLGDSLFGDDDDDFF